MNWQTVAIVLGNLVLAGFILWLIFHYKLEHDRRKSEERERLLGRFGTGDELQKLLNSDAGDKLLRVLARPVVPPAQKLMGPLRGSLALLGLGFGFLLLGWFNVVGGEAFFVPGTLLTFLGLGILASVMISASLLRRSGLLLGKDDGRGTDQP